MIDNNLEERESVGVFNLSQKDCIKNRDQVKKAEEIVEVIRQRDEKVFLLGKLEKQGDGEEKGEDDDATQHQSLDIF